MNEMLSDSRNIQSSPLPDRIAAEFKKMAESSAVTIQEESKAIEELWKYSDNIAEALRVLAYNSIL